MLNLMHDRLIQYEDKFLEIKDRIDNVLPAKWVEHDKENVVRELLIDPNNDQGKKELKTEIYSLPSIIMKKTDEHIQEVNLVVKEKLSIDTLRQQQKETLKRMILGMIMISKDTT